MVFFSKIQHAVHSIVSTAQVQTIAQPVKMAFIYKNNEASTFNICLPCNEACKTCFGSRISECLSCNNKKYIYPD